MKADAIRQALQEDEDWSRDLVEHTQDLLCIHDLQGRFLALNPTPARLLGYSVEELLKIPMRELSPPEFRPQFDAYLTQIGRIGEAQGLMAVMARSGERRIWQYHNTLRTEGVASPVVRGMAHDVTELVRTQSTLRATNAELRATAQERERTVQELKLFRSLLDQSNDAIQVIEPGTLRLLDVNERTCVELGYTREELLSMTIYDIAPEFDGNKRANVLRQLRESGFAVIERLHRRKNGTLFPVEVTLREAQLDNRTYGIAISRDVTARTRGEERLQEYERVVEGLEEMIIVVDRDYRYLIANRAFLRWRDKKKEEIVGRSAAENLDQETFATIVKPKMDECFTGKIVQYEMRYDYPKLGMRDGLVSYFPISGPSGVDRIACVLQDITERKRAESRLREYERVVEGVDEMISVIGRDHRYLLANRAYIRYRGLGEEQIIGHTVAENVGKEIFERVVKEKLDECFAGKTVQYEVRCAYPELGDRDIFVSYFPVEGPGGVDRIAVVVRDITERKQAEQSIRESEARERARAKELETVLAAVPVAVCIAHDTDAALITGNTAAYEQLGVPPGSNISRSALLGERPAFRVLENGVEVPPELLPIQQAASTGKPAYGRPLTILWEDGTRRETIANVVPLFNEHGKPRGAVAASIDVTELKQAEEALRQSEQRFRIALAGSPVKVFNQDKDLRYTWVYNLQEGWTESEYLGKSDDEIFEAEDAARMTALKRQVLESGKGVREEITIHARGKTYYCDLTVEPLLDAAGAVVGINCACGDVTHLREILEELRIAKERLTEEKLYLEQSIDTELGFGEIIGQSEALRSVMEHVAKVASSEATVLVLGETGTGKELVARAIHRMSRRRDSAFIKMNCAAIPSGLLESELFGHEKGAFTGAVSKKLGRLELADGGTLFLDEIGEVPLDLQPKLLRVLQDHEFERLGGTQTLKVNFRLIAATNRELLADVSKNLFRSDLYYRLNVFPIRVPALRERREDIPMLVEHFVRQYAGRMGKSITSVPKKTMDALTRWDWPGNIRELENFIERSVILTQGSVLNAPLGELDPADRPPVANEQPRESRSPETERDRLLLMLRACRGEIAGPKGAAMRLGLKRSALLLKMKQWGIKPEEFRK